MKGIFIAYDQAYNMDIADAIQKIGVRGFTMWQDIAGRGSETGEPHLGSHAWPTMNNAMLTFVPDDKVDEIMAQLRAMDEETPDLGRIFTPSVLPVTDSLPAKIRPTAWIAWGKIRSAPCARKQSYAVDSPSHSSLRWTRLSA